MLPTLPTQRFHHWERFDYYHPSLSPSAPPPPPPAGPAGASLGASAAAAAPHPPIGPAQAAAGENAAYWRSYHRGFGRCGRHWRGPSRLVWVRAYLTYFSSHVADRSPPLPPSSSASARSPLSPSSDTRRPHLAAIGLLPTAGRPSSGSPTTAHGRRRRRSERRPPSLSPWSPPSPSPLPLRQPLSTQFQPHL